MKTLIRSILKEIWERKINRKKNLLKKLAREIKKITLLDIGSAGGISPRWSPITKNLHYIGIEPDQRSSEKLSEGFDFKDYQIINQLFGAKEKKSLNLAINPKYLQY